jgi:uncharacterized protein YfkK (UPF0435 family)
MERYEKLIKSLENILEKLGVVTDDFDNITEYQEAELEKLDDKIYKVICKEWEETNHKAAYALWERAYNKSKYSSVIKHLH